MPLNLAQTAISAIRLGENALTAIYSGITRVYPNAVTVSIDGANASTQSGTPGQSMNNLIYIVNPSSSSTSGWTAAQISAATLTGLPTGFTATFSASGGLGSQVGTWSINTTDGLLPSVDTAIAVSSLTSTIAQTSYGTLNVSITGSDVVNTTASLVGFVGTNTSVTAVGTYITDVGYLIGNTGTSFPMQGTYVSGQNFTSFAAGGVNSYRSTSTFYYTINSTGTTNASASASGYASGIYTATQATYTIVNPPWSANPIGNASLYTNVNYAGQGYQPTVDSRVQYWVWISYTNAFAFQQAEIPYYFFGSATAAGLTPDVNSNNRFFSKSLGAPPYPSGANSSGSYTVNIENNVGVAGSTWASNNAARNASPVATTSWNWRNG